MKRTFPPPRTRAAAPLAALLVASAACTAGPVRDDVYRLPAPYNFAFYDTYEHAARSFYAAHYTHFGAYETLLDHGEEAREAMARFALRVREAIASPPRFEPPADLIAPDWSRLAYETGQSMHWTHMLHSQLYDILSDPRVADRRAVGERAIAYYLSEPRKAFSTRGYGHRWMEGGGTWAGAFRERYPEINGILWAFHWHHAAVYEALMESDPEARRRELDRVIAVFTDSVLADPPTEMPLTAEVAPRFSEMLPAAAHIFDNLHMMHDVVNDIMADASFRGGAKAAEIERLRLRMVYATQDTVTAPPMPMAPGQEMSHAAMRVPTRRPDGRWLPQGHPAARMAGMEELMRPLAPGPDEGGSAGAAHDRAHPRGAARGEGRR